MNWIFKAAMAAIATSVLVSCQQPSGPPQQTLTLSMNERAYQYSPTGKLCAVDVAAAGTAAQTRLLYTVSTNSGLNDLCRMTYRDGGYEGPYCEIRDKLTSCDDISAVTMHSLGCFDAAGAPMACSGVTLAGDSRLVAGPRLDRPRATEIIFAAVEDELDANAPDGCNIVEQYSYTPAAANDAVNIEYTVFAKGQKAKSCNIYRGPSGGGGSCSVSFEDYACADIDRIRVDDLQCRDTAGENRDCGSVGYRGVGISSVDG